MNYLRLRLLVTTGVLNILLAAAAPAVAQYSGGDTLDPPEVSDNPHLETPWRSGGDGSSPWPSMQRTLERSLLGAPPESATSLRLGEKILVAWSGWSGSDLEIVVGLLSADGAFRTVTVGNGPGDDLDPRLVAGPGATAGVVWIDRRPSARWLTGATLDPESGDAAPPVRLQRVGPRVGATAFPSPAGFVVVRAVRRGKRVVVEALEPDSSPITLAVTSGPSPLPLASAVQPDGSVVVAWPVDARCLGLLTRDPDGHWTGPSFVIDPP